MSNFVILSLQECANKIIILNRIFSVLSLIDFNFIVVIG